MSEEKKEKKAPAKKATTAKKTATKATAKKTTTKTAAKKPATKVAKTATKAATKTAAKKTTTKAATKTTAKKTAAKTTTKKAATKTTAKKTAAKTTKKTTTKKTPAKRTTRAKKVEEVVADDAKLIQDLEMEDAALNTEPVVETPVEVPVEVPVESTSTNEFGTTTISAEVSKAYIQQPVEEQPFTTTVSQEEKKARKGGRKVIITMVIVIILAIAAFLGLWYFSKITAHNKIVDTLDKLKAGDQATEVELIDLTNTLGLDVPTETNTENVSDLLITNNETNTNTDTDTTTSLTNEIIQQSKKDEKDYIDFFKKMEYEIVEEKADFVDGYVKVKIINKNIGKIIKKYYVRAFALSIRTAFSTQESSQVQENLDSYLKQLLTSDEIERVSTEVTFKLKREGFEWKLDVNKEELCDAILPGLREQLKDFEF